MFDENAKFTRAATANGQFDDQAMTITAVIATATPVTRRDVKGPYSEILNPKGVQSEKEVPLLDGHAQGSIRNVIGVANNIRVEDGQLLADLRFSLADDVQPIVQRVKDGTASRFSVGYRILKTRDSLSGNNRIRTALEWELTEVSLVPIGADPNAKRRNKRMLTEEKLIAPEAEQQQIRELAELAGLTRGWAEDQIDSGATLETARSAALAQMQGRSQQVRIRTVTANDDPAVIVRRQTDALAFRAAGGELPEDARQFAEMSFRDLAVSSLERAGVSARGMSTDEVFTRAAMGTSDFPLVVSNVANKIALDRFNAAASALMPLVRKRNLPNFKASTSIRVGELNELKPLAEDGEIQHTGRTENGETLQLATFASGLNVSRKLLIDDDANLLGDMTATLADAAANTVSNKLAALLMTDQKLSDGKNVFHADRKNLAGAAWDLSVASLSASRKDMRTVKGLDGKTIVGAAPEYLVVGPEMETQAELVLSEIYASDVSAGNPFAKKLILLVEPRISDNRWFLFASPARLPVLQMAYLSSAQGVQIQRTEAWDTLGMRFRAFLDFGCGFADWRGAFAVKGA